MSSNKEIVPDKLWEEMKSFAVEQQQYFYELLYEWIEYKFCEHKYLRQNIGYAIYGLPTNNENASENEDSGMENSCCYWKPEDSIGTDADVTDSIQYNEKAKNVIDLIYNKICECTIGTDNTRSINFAIIYNIIFRPKMNKKSQKKEEVKEEAKKKTTGVEEEDEQNALSPIPIFKFRRDIKKNSKKESTKTEKIETDYEIWYIDTCGRVYKSWTDYIENNTLPKCTMVLPKDGFYQADLSYPVTEEYSRVWIEIIDSPACSWTSAFCNGMNVGSIIAALGSSSLSVASMFTPIGPALTVTGFVAIGVSSIWTFGRSSQQLVDRKSHEESIHISNKEAISHWLGIAGTTFGLGALGGSAALSNAVANGKTIPTFAKAAFNAVQGGNLFLNGAGIVYQGYNMIDRYRTDRTVSRVDALNLAIHIMFFAGTVVKVQFANDIIENTQGRVINEYRDTLRKKNLIKKFNRTMRKAANNNTCRISENQEVIQYIKNREQLTSQSVVQNQTVNKILRQWSFEQGKLKVNGVILLDPIEYVIRLTKSDIFNENNHSDHSSGSQNPVDPIIEQLTTIFSDLLTKFYLSDACPKNTNLPLMPDFEPLLKDMSLQKIDEKCLKKLFEIVIKLIKRSKNKEDFLLMAFSFVWQYCKANLGQRKMDFYVCMQTKSNSKILRTIIIAISEALDMMLHNLCSAFVQYVNANLRG